MVDESPAGAAGRPGDPDAAGIVPQRQLNLDVLRHIIKFADGPAVVAACAGVCRLWREGADTAWGTLAQRRWATANKRWRPWEEWLDAGAEYCRSMYRSRHETDRRVLAAVEQLAWPRRREEALRTVRACGADALDVLLAAAAEPGPHALGRRYWAAVALRELQLSLATVSLYQHAVAAPPPPPEPGAAATTSTPPPATPPPSPPELGPALFAQVHYPDADVVGYVTSSVESLANELQRRMAAKGVTAAGQPLEALKLLNHLLFCLPSLEPAVARGARGGGGGGGQEHASSGGEDETASTAVNDDEEEEEEGDGSGALFCVPLRGGLMPLPPATAAVADAVVAAKPPGLRQLPPLAVPHDGCGLGLRCDRGNNCDPRKLMLNDLLLRRNGLPITLAVLHMAVGRRCGLDIGLVGLPGHAFTINMLTFSSNINMLTFSSVADGEPRQRYVYIDVYNRGQLLDRLGGLESRELTVLTAKETCLRMALYLETLYVHAACGEPPLKLDVFARTTLLCHVTEMATVLEGRYVVGSRRPQEWAMVKLIQLRAHLGYWGAHSQLDLLASEAPEAFDDYTHDMLWQSTNSDLMAAEQLWSPGRGGGGGGRGHSLAGGPAPRRFRIGDVVDVGRSGETGVVIGWDDKYFAVPGALAPAVAAALPEGGHSQPFFYLLMDLRGKGLADWDALSQPMYQPQCRLRLRGAAMPAFMAAAFKPLAPRDDEAGDDAADPQGSAPPDASMATLLGGLMQLALSLGTSTTATAAAAAAAVRPAAAEDVLSQRSVCHPMLGHYFETVASGVVPLSAVPPALLSPDCGVGHGGPAATGNTHLALTRFQPNAYMRGRWWSPAAGADPSGSAGPVHRPTPSYSNDDDDDDVCEPPEFEDFDDWYEYYSTPVGYRSY